MICFHSIENADLNLMIIIPFKLYAPKSTTGVHNCVHGLVFFVKEKHSVHYVETCPLKGKLLVPYDGELLPFLPRHFPARSSEFSGLEATD